MDFLYCHCDTRVDFLFHIFFLYIGYLLYYILAWHCGIFSDDNVLLEALLQVRTRQRSHTH